LAVGLLTERLVNRTQGRIGCEVQPIETGNGGAFINQQWKRQMDCAVTASTRLRRERDDLAAQLLNSVMHTREGLQKRTAELAPVAAIKCDHQGTSSEQLS